MGNCTASRLAGVYSGGDDEGSVVDLCRRRKRLLKAAVDRRYALADAHSRYVHSLQSVAAAIHLFVARHGSPSPPYLVLPSDPPPPLPSPPPPPPEPSLPGPPSSPSSESESESVSEDREPPGCGYFYSEVPAQSPDSDIEWDFFSFNPFHGVRAEAAMMGGGLCRTWDEDLRVVREEEGIPELEEEEEDGRQRAEEKEGLQEQREVVVGGGGEVVKEAAGEDKMGAKEHKGLTVIDTPARERELLDALRDVEDHFLRACDSGKEVSRMLEANRYHLQSGLEEIKENSSKFFHAITWHRVPSQSSYSSSLSSSSKSNSCWTEYKNDLFEDYGGMESGSHSLTLGRLYAWEKKLYDEVKAGDKTRRMYERKCLQLRNLDARGDDSRTVDKTRNVVKDLHTRIWVALRTAESISDRIQKLRDEELQPQLFELLQGFMRTWKTMLESHETQRLIMFEVKSFTSSTYGRFSGDPHKLATLQLETEIQNWRACFTAYIAAQRAYVEALSGWLSKFLVPEVEFCSRSRSSAPQYHSGAPPLVVICHDWLNSLDELPDSSVAFAMKSFTRDVKALWIQQGEEQQQKRKVDILAKDLDRRLVAFQKTESRILESKISQKSEPDVRQRVEYLAGRKDVLHMFRNKLDMEKVKHHDCMQETQRIILNGFQTGLASIFESLAEFSKASLNMYSELVTDSEKARAGDNRPSCIEGSKQQVDSHD